MPDLDELARRLAEARVLGDSPESSQGVKLRWFEGLAELRLRRPSGAVPRLRSAYDGLMKLQARGYAAACALDLAEVHLADGDPAVKPQNGMRIRGAPSASC